MCVLLFVLLLSLSVSFPLLLFKIVTALLYYIELRNTELCFVFSGDLMKKFEL